MFCRCHQRANSGFQIERMVYDEGWDLFGYAGWSPKLEAMVVSFRYAANPPKIIQSLPHVSVLALLSVMVTSASMCMFCILPYLSSLLHVAWLCNTTLNFSHCILPLNDVWAPGCIDHSGNGLYQGNRQPQHLQLGGEHAVLEHRL